MMPTLFDMLTEPFPTECVSWRVGPTKQDGDKMRGQVLAYIDARAVMDRLDSVLGPENWQCSYTPGVGASIVCNIAVSIAGEWIWKADGAGPSDVEADKGALSDAFKRAAVRWGVGRYLYDMRSPWIELEMPGKRISKDYFAKLDRLHDETARGIMAKRKTYEGSGKGGGERDHLRSQEGRAEPEAKRGLESGVRAGGGGDGSEVRDGADGYALSRGDR
jgi:hypothetical protein